MSDWLIERMVRGVPTSDGAGVRLTRVLTQHLQMRLDPFLMLDSFCSDRPDDYIGGFPDHPHRGFETVTYMLAGRMRHRDSGGNEGLLEPNGAQWMTAGSGLIHSELPEQENGLMEGFQLWLNLPAAEKMCEPAYRDIPAAEIPELLTQQGVLVRVLAGTSQGVEGAMQRPITEPLFLDIHLPAGTHFEQPIPAAHNAFIYVYRGELEVAGQTVGDRHMAILKQNGSLPENPADPRSQAPMLRLQAKGAPARTLVIAGRPLREPIVQHGPFVMNSTEQIYATVRDYQRGDFHRAKVKKLAA